MSPEEERIFDKTYSGKRETAARYSVPQKVYSNRRSASCAFLARNVID